MMHQNNERLNKVAASIAKIVEVFHAGRDLRDAELYSGGYIKIF